MTSPALLVKHLAPAAGAVAERAGRVLAWCRDNATGVGGPAAFVLGLGMVWRPLVPIVGGLILWGYDVGKVRIAEWASGRRREP
jgi:hypothetical protein